MALTLSETRRFAERARAASSFGTRALAAVTRTTQLTVSGLILLGLSIGAWILGYIVGGRPLYLLSYGGLTVLVLSWLIGRRPLPLEGRRGAARARRREGETLSMEVELTATRRLSTFILEEKVPPMLGFNARIPVASLDAGDSVGHSYRLTCWRRGVYELGPLVAKWGDPFGFTEREIPLADKVEFLVHPSTEPVEDRPLTRLWEDPPVRPPVSKPWPSGMEFYGMRQYQPGDDVRKVVWRAFARTGELLVREAEQGITDKMTVILDQSREAHSTGIISESFEAGIRVAGSLIVHYGKEGYAVTLEGNDHRLAGPLRGGNSHLLLLDELARVDLSHEPLKDAITRVVYDSGRDSHVVVITPDLDPEAASQIELIRSRGSSVLVAALMWSDFATETLAKAAAMGCQVIEVRPNTPLSVAFRHEVGAGLL